ncbi:MAG: hypothetical protein M1575_01090 [Patescibacteria group bacterium]|nr:hypothetical protein [Patescibacteria group bacterium]MCL5095314.1 hypothetical protein [Patescibacteria group bacterium]
MVTARPYSPKETFSRHTYIGQIDALPSIPKLQSFIAQGGKIDLLDHFFPHIRGLLSSQRGNHYFWYKLSYNWWLAYEKKLELALKKKGVSYLDIYIHTFSSQKSYLEVWEELEAKPGFVDQRKTCRPDFPYQRVSAEEFIQGYKTETQDLVVYYPLRVNGFIETLPLFVAPRTGLKSKERKPVVLGIYAENGCTGFCHRGGILRIKNRELAGEISSLISRDFGLQVDTVLFTPCPGRPLYERVAGYQESKSN